MKKILVAVSFIVLAALIYPMIASKRSDEGMSREASNLRQLLICVVHYTKEKNEFPQTIQSALDLGQLNEKMLNDFISDPNFRYLKPETSPEDTNPYTTIIEFRTVDGIYEGNFAGYAVFHDTPSSQPDGYTTRD